MFHTTDPLSITDKCSAFDASQFEPILIQKESAPRQGVNTCGANEVFFFSSCEPIGEQLVCVANKAHQGIVLPRQFVYPLITAQSFQSPAAPPHKWVLLPYQPTGRPLTGQQLSAYPELQAYLWHHRAFLQQRKGIILQKMMSSGHWWALLGVGSYNFFPFKIVWEAYGRSAFNPQIFEGHWQANQSLQAFIPMKTLDEAQRILAHLQDKRVERYLLSLKMEGTMNWAQPGKIKKLLQVVA
jgi:hypothetical protein